MRRRSGRPGLLNTMARTAVIAGTASAVSGNVQASQAASRQAAADKVAREQAAAAELGDLRRQVDALQAGGPVPPAPPAPPAPVAPVAPPAPPAPPAGGDLVAQLQQLAALRDAGALSDDEFAAAKARLLG